MEFQNLFSNIKRQNELELEHEILEKMVNLHEGDRINLERKKEKLIRYAKEAIRKGDTSKYNMAKDELKTIIIFQKKLRNMLAIIDKMVSMGDFINMRRDIINALSAAEKEMTHLIEETNFIKPKHDSEKEKVQEETLLQQLEHFLNDLEVSPDEENDEEINREIECLMD